MSPKPKPPAWRPIALLLMLLCAGCSTVSPPLIVQPKQRELPAEARQPPQEPECVPTCLAGWERSVDDMLRSPTPAAPPAAPASASAPGA